MARTLSRFILTQQNDTMSYRFSRIGAVRLLPQLQVIWMLYRLRKNEW